LKPITSGEGVTLKLGSAFPGGRLSGDSKSSFKRRSAGISMVFYDSHGDLLYLLNTSLNQTQEVKSNPFLRLSQN
jgi:hypothetical protein